MTTTTDPIAAITAAESAALAAHESGACQASEWSCSYCESERVGA